MIDNNNVARTAMAQAFGKVKSPKDAAVHAQRGLPPDLRPGESMANWALRKQQEAKPTARKR